VSGVRNVEREWRLETEKSRYLPELIMIMEVSRASLILINFLFL
jgi:hypothetical protein